MDILLTKVKHFNLVGFKNLELDVMRIFERCNIDFKEIDGNF